MMCRRCGRPMREEKRSYHKKRKWVCPRCVAGLTVKLAPIIQGWLGIK